MGERVTHSISSQAPKDDLSLRVTSCDNLNGRPGELDQREHDQLHKRVVQAKVLGSPFSSIEEGDGEDRIRRVSGERRADESSVDGVEFDGRRVTESDVTLRAKMKAFRSREGEGK